MYSGSTEFNNLIEKSGGNALKSRLIFSDFTLENLKKLEYHGGSNNSDDIAIGTTNMAYLEVGVITDKYITNQEFLLEVGMELSDGTIEYAPMGYFTVQKPDSDEDSVSFRAYDRMQKFEKSYFSALTYPTDSAKVLNELCTMCGVELATPIASPITIEDNLEGYTCREVLGYIAGIHGYFACIDRYGKLNLRWYSETPIEKQIGLIWSLTKSQDDYTVEKITLAKDSETTYTSGDGISGINHSNPYATQAIADSIYTSLGGFTYRVGEISMLDDIRLDPWDMVQVTYFDGSVLKIPVMSLEHSFTNCETKIKSFGKTDTENEYNYSGPITQAMNRMSTELLVANRVIATKVDAEWVNAHTVTVTELEATNVRVGTLEANALTAETADLRYATITNLNAQTVRIDDLEATALTADSAVITDLQTNKLDTSDLSAEVAKLGYLTADSADLRYANITLGNIDTANIDVANIGLLFAKVGLIDRATIVDGHITGYLDAVEINANNITAGTLIADRILLKGSESGLLYALNNLGELTSTEVDTLDGTILTERTVTADKLVANSITANELDVTNIFGNSAVLSTLTSQQAFINAISTNSVVVGASNMANEALNTATNITPFISGTQTAATGSWTGVAPFAELKDGQQITYWLPYAGSGNATLNLTLSGGSTTGAINCYYGGTTRLTTHYPAGSAIRLTYRASVIISGTAYTGWWADANYDSGNTYDRTRYAAAIKASAAIVAANIIVGDSSGYHHLKTGGTFDISYPILYAGSAIASGSTGTNNYIIIPMAIATTQSLTLTAYKSLYIKGKLSGSTFTPVSTAPITQTIPTTEDGYDYILLGTAYATTAFYLLAEHPIFKYIDGSFQQIGVGANNQAQGIIDNIYTTNTTTIDGGKITTGSINADKIDVNSIFAENITATGSITGVKLYGTYAEIGSGNIGGFSIGNNYLQAGDFETTAFTIKINADTTYDDNIAFEITNNTTANSFYVNGRGFVYLNTPVYLNKFMLMGPGQEWFIEGEGGTASLYDLSIDNSLTVYGSLSSVGDVIAGYGTDNQISLLDLVDVAPEYGGSAADGYIRFPNLKLQIAWKRVAISTTINTAFGSGYMAGGFSMGNWAAAFNANPATTYSVACNANVIVEVANYSKPTTTSAGIVYLLRNNAVTASGTYYISAIAIGTYT